MAFHGMAGVAVVLLAGLIGGYAGTPAQGAPARLNDLTEALPADQELLVLQARATATVRVLITRTNDEPKGIFVIYPGGEGLLIKYPGTKPMPWTAESLRGRGYISAVVDSPSDQPEGQAGIHERSRLSRAHTTDALAVISALQERWPLPVYLVGHSMGTLSVAHIGASRDPRIKGVVMLSSLGRRGTSASIPSTAIQDVEAPVLLVHHKADGCTGSLYRDVLPYPKLFTRSARVGFISVTGGSNPRSDDPCANTTAQNHHAFFDQRGRVWNAVIQWLNGADVDFVE